ACFHGIRRSKKSPVLDQALRIIKDFRYFDETLPTISIVHYLCLSFYADQSIAMVSNVRIGKHYGFIRSLRALYSRMVA
ncbi:MAG: hypothetical protein C7B45_16305, partial [Sulfobacillus acidophilus]